MRVSLISRPGSDLGMRVGVSLSKCVFIHYFAVHCHLSIIRMVSVQPIARTPSTAISFDKTANAVVTGYCMLTAETHSSLPYQHYR